FQYLVLGSAAGEVQLTPVWRRYYVPVILLFVSGMGQRDVSAVRPAWTWVLPVSRTFISGIGAVVMFFFRKHPLVMVSSSAKDLAHAAGLAASKNGLLVWGIFGVWLWMYLAIGAVIYAWYSLPHLRHLLSRRG